MFEWVGVIIGLNNELGVYELCVVELFILSVAL